jgi:hypothetical protein
MLQMATVIRSVILAVSLLLIAPGPAEAWHPWKKTEVPLTKEAEPKPVLEIRPTRGTIETHEGREFAKAIGRSVILTVAVRGVLIGVSILTGIPVF